ncbi:recombinase family protein [Buttiauxella sp. W03-F01]|uniref:recombinase family protein n=1 Tax=Buttiauxella sp. S04-F03 TaxID=2904525 RepID=UPI0012AD5AFD|nr:recombinase family protein [Buttiauxella sp. S04-F03]MRT15164.1 serine recombinase [Enterobacteriaceae bacterium RIT711]
MSIETIKNVVIAARVSTDEQAESGLGIESQIAACRELAARMNWQVIESPYIDGGVSATVHPSERPELAKALTVVNAMNAKARKEKRAADTAILVAKQDRITRSVAHREWLEAHTVFICADSPNASKLESQVNAMFGQAERERIAARTVAALGALKARADAGDTESQEKIARRDAGRTAAHEQKTYLVAAAAKADAANADALTMRPHFITARADGATSLRQIAAYLNEQGSIKTPKGTEWTAAAVSRVIKRLEAMGKW